MALTLQPSRRNVTTASRASRTVLGFVVGWVVPDGQSETVREGYRGTFNAFGFLSAWRQLCFAGFVSRSA